MKPRDWTLLVIAAANGGCLSPVQLQKTLFLVGEKLDLPKGSRYQFAPYDYGPFSKAVYDDAESLQRDGFVFVEHSGPYRTYLATKAGIDRAQALRAKLDDRSRTYLDALVRWVRSQSFKGLVEAIYAEFPHMRERSVFQS